MFLGGDIFSYLTVRFSKILHQKVKEFMPTVHLWCPPLSLYIYICVYIYIYIYIYIYCCSDSGCVCYFNGSN